VLSSDPKHATSGADVVLGQGMRLTALGIVLGIVAAFWVTRWLSSLLFA